MRGKNGIGGGGVGEGGGGSYTHPHRFEKYNYTAPAYCDLCNSVLWGIVRTGYRCQVSIVMNRKKLLDLIRMVKSRACYISF